MGKADAGISENGEIKMATSLFSTQYWKYYIFGFIALISIIVIMNFAMSWMLRMKKSRKSKIHIVSGKEAEILHPYSYVEHIKGFSFKAFKQRWILKRKTPIGITMELNNGDYIQFLADAGKSDFKYRGKTYIIDENLKYFMSSSRLYFIDYHENFTLPIKRKIPLKEIQKSMTSEKYSQENIYYATNPKTLENFLTSSTIEKILSGAKLDEWLRQMRLMIIIILIVAVLHMVLFAVKSGMLAKVKIF